MHDSPYLAWHPSSPAARHLDDHQACLVKEIKDNPQAGIRKLVVNYHFGRESDLWDDYIFNQCIRPVLAWNACETLQTAVDRYSCIDHELFTTYIRREEDPVRFRRAFWHVNSYGLGLAHKFAKQASHKSNHAVVTSANACKPKGIKYKIAFILKGPYKLAHCEFLHAFLQGSIAFANRVDIFLILLDDKPQLNSIDHVKVISLAGLKTTHEKLVHYYSIFHKYKFDNICWVACVQNLSLYMGAQLAPTQSYWSMKYHSIIMPTIQKYAGLGFGGKSFRFDDVQWFRGRAFPELNMRQVSEDKRYSLMRSKNIPFDAVVVGCFVRSEKLHSPEYWKAVSELLSQSTDIHFIIASQSIPRVAAGILSLMPYKERFHHLGWVNTKEWAYVLDLYFDSSPRGSCNTIFEAICAGVPILMADSDYNRESSALPYLQSAVGAGNSVPGSYSSLQKRLAAAKVLVADPNARRMLAKQQKKLLESLQDCSHLFAKDYLNYFSDKQLTLTSKY